MANITPKSNSILLIALFKLFKGVMLSLIALGTYRLIHRDIHESLVNWSYHLHVDPGGRKINTLISKASAISPDGLRELAAGEVVYASLLFTEGVGLIRRRRWAEYITVISTALFIPVEVYELIEKMSAVKFCVLGINIAIVCYLIVRLRAAKHEEIES